MLPPKFSGLDLSQAAIFIRGYNDVVQAYDKDYSSDTIILNRFKLSLTGQARDWFDTNNFETWQACMDAFKKQFNSKPSIISALKSYNGVPFDQTEGPRIFYSKLKSAAKDAGITSIRMDFFMKLPPEYQKDIIQGKGLDDEGKMLDIAESSWEASKVFQNTQKEVNFTEQAHSGNSAQANKQPNLHDMVESAIAKQLSALSIHSVQEKRGRDQTPYYKRNKDGFKSRSHSREKYGSQSRDRYRSHSKDRFRSRSHERHGHDSSNTPSYNIADKNYHQKRDRSRNRSNERSYNRYDKNRNRSQSRDRTVTCEACKKPGHSWNTCFKVRDTIKQGKMDFY